MVLKSHNLIRTGLTSELFLLAFFRPDTAYVFAQRLQNTKTKPNTGKIYPAIKSLTNAGYLKHFENKFYPNYTKLISDINKELKKKNKSLKEDEVKIIELILKHGQIFWILSFNALQKLIKQKNGVHKVDALQTICDIIGEWATIWLFKREREANIKKSISKLEISSYQKFVSIFNELDKELSDIPTKLNLKMEQYITDKKNEFDKLSNNELEFIKDGRNFIRSIPSFIVFGLVPKNTLRKMSMLWTQHDGFNLGVKFAGQISSKSRTLKK